MQRTNDTKKKIMNIFPTIQLILLLAIQTCETSGTVLRRRKVKFPKSTLPFFPISKRDSAELNLDFNTLSREVNKGPNSSNFQVKSPRKGKSKQKKRRVVHLEKTVIPFSKLAEIKGSLSQNKDLVTTIERGVRFIGALNSKITSSSEANDHDIASSSLEIDVIQDGVDFLKGSMKKLESQPFFEQLQSEIFTFHSVPRSKKEIQDFQRRVHERIKAFISLNELVLVKAVPVAESFPSPERTGSQGRSEVLSTSFASPMIR